MSDRLIPTKAQVLAAAEQCPETKKALQILFPDDFQSEFVQFDKGTFFLSYGDDLVLLAQVGPEQFTLVDMKDGNRWFTPFVMGFKNNRLVMNKKAFDEEVKMSVYKWEVVQVTLNVKKLS